MAQIADTTQNLELLVFRKLKLWTRGELADAINSNVATLKKYETCTKDVNPIVRDRIQQALGVQFRGNHIPESEWIDISNPPKPHEGAEVGWFLQEVYNEFDGKNAGHHKGTAKERRNTANWRHHKLGTVTGIPRKTLQIWFERYLNTGHTRAAYQRDEQYVKKLRLFKENHYVKGKEHCNELYKKIHLDRITPIKAIPNQTLPLPESTTVYADQTIRLISDLSRLIIRLEKAPITEYKIIETHINEIHNELTAHNNHLLGSNK